VALRTVSEGAQEQTTIIDLFDGSALVIQGKVENVLPQGRGRIQLARIHVSQVIKGSLQTEKLLVAEELRFPSDPPSYHKAKGVTLFLIELPHYSKWKSFRSKGVRYMAAQGRDGVREMESRPLAETADFLKTYFVLSTREDGQGKPQYVDFLINSLENPLEFIQEASASALSRIDNISSFLSQQDRERLIHFLRNKDKSLGARRRLVQTVGNLDEFRGVIAQLIREDPRMRLVALDALTSDEGYDKITMEMVRACLEDPDASVRYKALDLLFKSQDPKADVLLGELALGDPSIEIRARAMSAMGKKGSDTVEEIASRALEDTSPFVGFIASDEIRKIGGKGSARTLGKLIQTDDPTVRFIGLIMLGAMEEEEARSILQETSETHQDQKTRETAKKILNDDTMDITAIRKILGVDEVLNRANITGN